MRAILAWMIAFTPALAQVVELLPSTSPSAVQPVVTDVALTATRGLPAGVTASQLLVLVTPQNVADGPQTQAPVTSITTIGSRTTIRFRVPAYSNSKPIPATILVTQSPGSPALRTAIPAETLILPSPSLESVWPPSTDRGSTLDVTIRGLYTSFPANASNAVINFGPEITAVPKVCPSGASATLICATLTVQPGATLGPRQVFVIYGSTTIALANAFSVTSAGPRPLRVDRGSINQSATLGFTFTLPGANLNASSNVSWNLGPQLVGTNPVIIDSQTISLSVAVDKRALLGPRDVVFFADGFVYSASGLITVNPFPSSISFVSPNSLQPGVSDSILISATGTSFLQNLTSVTMGSGITVASVDVISPTLALARVSVAASASGNRFVTVTTQGEAPAPALLKIETPVARICGVSPSSAIAGTSGLIALQFCNVTPDASFIADIPGNTDPRPQTISRGNLIVPFTFASNVTPSKKLGKVSVGRLSLGFDFTVLPAGPSLVTVCREPSCDAPARVNSSDAFTLRVTGSATNWVPDQTEVRFTVDGTNSTSFAQRTTVISPTELVADFKIVDMPAGTATISIRTLAQPTPVSLSAVEILRPPVLSISPSSGLQGSSVQVSFTISSGGSLPAVCPAFLFGSAPAGITCQNYSLLSSTQATATLVIDPLAPIGPRSTEPVAGVNGSFLVRQGAAAFSSTARYPVFPIGAIGGTSVLVQIIGESTHFCSSPGCANPTTVAFTGPVALAASNISVQSPTRLSVAVDIPPGTPPGNYLVQVSTLGEIITRAAGFRVLGQAPSLQITPNAGAQGSQLVSTATYSNLPEPIFPGDAATLDLGPGILTTGINNYPSQISIRFNHSISPTTAIGPRSPLATVHGVPTLVASAFTVSKGSAAIQSVAPNQSDQGTTLNLVVTGSGTNFAQNLTQLSFGGTGITVQNLTVISPTSLNAQITIAANAPTGVRSISATTDGESAQLSNAFTVTAGVPALIQISPSTCPQATLCSISVTGRATAWQNTITTADFGPGVRMLGFLVSSSTTANAAPRPEPTATLGKRTVTVTTGSQVLTLVDAFEVTKGVAFLQTVSPSLGAQRDTNLQLTINGVVTNFQSGITSVVLTGPGPSLTAQSVTVNSATSLTARISIPANHPPGAYTVTAITDGENAVWAGVFTVNATLPQLQSSPASAKQGQTLALNLSGTYTDWVQGTTTVTCSCGTVSQVTVSSPTSLTAQIAVPVASALGAALITVTTGPQVVTANINIVSGPTLNTITPARIVSGQTVAFTITGNATQWVPGATTLTFSSPGLNAGVVSVNSPTSITVNVSASNNVALGAVDVTVTSGNQSSAGKSIEVIGGLRAVTPNYVKQNSTVDVWIDAVPEVTFVDGQSTAFFRGDFTVNSTTVLSPSRMKVNLTIPGNLFQSPSSPPIQLLPSVTTGGMTATGPSDAADKSARFFVTPIAPVTLSNPSFYQGSAEFFLVTGSTYCCAAPTTLDLGSDVLLLGGTNGPTSEIPLTVTINNAWQAANQFATSPYAPVGPRTGLVRSGIYSYAIPFTVTDGGSRLLSVAPSSAKPGDTVDVVVSGQFTHFTLLAPGYGVTSIPDFGAGITATVLNVISPTQLRVRLQIHPAATLGQRSPVVTTGGEISAGSNLFQIAGAQLQSISPATGQQGQIVAAIIAGQLTNFSAQSAISLGPDILITAGTTTPASIQASIAISPLATPGPRTLTVDGLTLPNAFTITVGPATLTSVSPASGPVNTQMIVQITGSQTNFQQGLTTASFGAGISVNTITVNNPLQVTVDLSISPSATLGARDVVITTGGQQVLLSGGFQVTGGAPVISGISPSSGAMNTTASNIQVTGSGFTGATFTVAGSQTLSDSGVLVGATIQSVTNLTNNSATLQVRFGGVTGSFALVATNAIGASTSNLTPTNQLSIFAGGGYAASRAVTVVGTRTTPLDPPQLTSRYASTRAATVLNTTGTPLDPSQLTLRYASSSAATVLNASASPIDTAQLALRYSSSRAVNVTNQSSPAFPVSASTGAAGPRTTVATQRTGSEIEVAYPGQDLQIGVEIPTGVPIDAVHLYVNGVRTDAPKLAPYNTVITVPYGIPDIEIVPVVISGNQQIAGQRRFIKVEEDRRGRQLPLHVEDPEKRAATGMSVSFRYYGFLVEHFHWSQPLLAIPAIEAERKPDRTGFSALLNIMPSPGDPLGAGAIKDTVSRYRAFLSPLESGDYEFQLKATAGATLKFDGKPYRETDALYLDSGKPVEVEVTHFRSIEPVPGLQLLWRRALPLHDFEPIRPEFLRTAPVPASQPVPLAVTRLDAYATSPDGTGQTLSFVTTEPKLSIRIQAIKKPE